MKYISEKDIRLPRRRSGSRKGDNGKVLIIGGSEDYVGAVALAGLAALRSGVDWVTVAAPEKVGWAINSLTSDLVVKKFNRFIVSDFLKLEKGFDAVLIGSGMGMRSGRFVKAYTAKTRKNLVIDADALKLIRIQDVENSVLTPHKKELEMLLKNSKMTKKNMRKNIGSNVLLVKGKTDEIMTKSRSYCNKTGNAGMTKAGTGDVLAGLCVGFLGQGLSLLQSAINAAYFNGLAGDILLKKKKGFTYLASDLADEIKRILK